MQKNSFPSQQIMCNELCRMHGRSRRFSSGLQKGGFSLIEVVLALGVVSFAFVALFGLLPVGLNAFNNSIDSTVESQIAESVMTQLRQEKFSQLYGSFNDSAQSTNTSSGQPSFYKPTTVSYQIPSTGFFYDDQGNFLGLVQQNPPAGTLNPISSPVSTWNTIYTAGVQVYYDPWVASAGSVSAPPFNIQPTNTIIASGTSVNPITPQPMATVVITVRKVSSPNVARIYTGYIVNNGL